MLAINKFRIKIRYTNTHIVYVLLKVELISCYRFMYWFTYINKIKKKNEIKKFFLRDLFHQLTYQNCTLLTDN